MPTEVTLNKAHKTNCSSKVTQWLADKGVAVLGSFQM